MKFNSGSAILEPSMLVVELRTAVLFHAVIAFEILMSGDTLITPSFPHGPNPPVLPPSPLNSYPHQQVSRSISGCISCMAILEAHCRYLRLFQGLIIIFCDDIERFQFSTILCQQGNEVPIANRGRKGL